MCGTLLVRSCLSTRIKPRSSTSTPALPASRFLPFGTTVATRTAHHNAALRRGFAFHRNVDTVFFRFNGGSHWFSSIRLNFLLMRLVKRTLTMSLSAAGITRSISTTSISEPSAWYTVPISRPMIPPPMTSIYASALLSVPRASGRSARGSSCGINGNWIGREPAAMIALSKLITVLPFSPSTSSVRPGEFTRTVDHFHLTTLAIPARPPVSCRSLSLFRYESCRYRFRLTEDDTVFNQRFGFFDSFCYVQQRFRRRGAADVQTNTARGVCSVLITVPDLNQRNGKRQNSLPGPPKYHDLSFVSVLITDLFICIRRSGYLIAHHPPGRSIRPYL